jgi:FkbH-like protein
MFETQHRDANLWHEQSAVAQQGESKLSPRDVRRVLYLRWAEHCVECAVPECYKQCPLYVKRRDGQCSRFVYGIWPNEQFQGHYDFGADIRFRRWGKLEADLDWTTRMMSPGYERIFRSLPGRVRLVLSKYRVQRVLSKMGWPQPPDLDEFVIECFSPDRETFNLVIEHHDGDRALLLRKSFEIKPGLNFHRIQRAELAKVNRYSSGKLLLYLEEDHERRLIFTWLDFVKHRRAKPAKKPAALIKCLAWDLDNTLWKGILAETHDITALAPRPEALKLIRDLDRRGIIQTIVSKNTHAEAWKVIERLGLEDYFIYPAINWGPKSENLRQVAERINIGLDTIALIDDSAFERAEVSATLRQVRVYKETEIGELLAKPEFDTPVTNASKMRRHSYLANMKRGELQASFTGSYEEFLLSCGMIMKIFEPRSESELLRCWELGQRSNQLNISNRFYNFADFKAMLTERRSIGVAFDCRDKICKYGLVGFAILQPPALTDFVMSCRIAQKRVEHAFFLWLAERLKQRGFQQFRSRFVVSPKNKPMRDAMEQLPFRKISETDTHIDFAMDLNEERKPEHVVALELGALPSELNVDGFEASPVRQESDLSGGTVQ